MHKQHLPQILAEAALAGYDGLEIGAHRLDLNQPARFMQLLAENHLQLAALHVHGELWNAEAMRMTYDALVRVSDFASVVGAPFVLVSGRRYDEKTYDDFEREADSLNHAGQVCNAAHIRLLYHNHDWEIEHDLRELRFLRDNTDANLVSFGLDLGWVHRAGQSPEMITREFWPRTRAFHVKDHAGDRWVEVGAGRVDFAAWLAVLHELHPQADELWLTVERDEPLPNPAESATLSRRHLKTLGV